MQITERSTKQASAVKEAAQNLLGQAGIQINGNRSWDIQVHHPQFYARMLADGSLGLGESYMDGWWDCPALDAFFYRVLKARLDRSEAAQTWQMKWNYLRAKVLNLQSTSRAFEIGEKHYDRGNDLFERMLDKRMVYSCGYWQDATSLDEAQAAKLDLICRKIGLEAGDRVLDIGCGWGSFVQFAAENYGAEVVGVTVSEEQVRLGRKRCQGLPVEIRLADYRTLDEPFDHIVSIGMFEHVGPKNHQTFFDVARRCLREEGLLLLHTIGANRSTNTADPWINKYIFPNGATPSARQITEAIEGQFMLEDWHNFGTHYDKTLMAWHENFTAHWNELEGRYDERFFRMWTYYLLCCAGSFRARSNHLWQLVLSPNGVEGGYESVR